MSNKKDSFLFNFVKNMSLVVFFIIAYFVLMIVAVNEIPVVISVIILAAVVIPLLFIRSRIMKVLKNRAYNKEQAAIKYRKDSIVFYEKCRDTGIFYPISQDKINDLKNAAKNNNIPLDKCEEMYNYGYQEVFKFFQADDQKALEDLKSKMNLVGSSKYIQGLKEAFEDEYQYYLHISSVASEAFNRKLNSRTTTHSWAIAGGLAEGIGGTGLGIATAMDVQRKNILAEQRAAEEREKAYADLAALDSGNKTVDCEAQAFLKSLSLFEQAYKKLKRAEIPADAFVVNQTLIRESGTMSIDVSPNQQAFDGKKTLDGVVYVAVKDKNTIIGEGFITFPGYLNSYDKEKTIQEIDNIGLNKFESKQIICRPRRGYRFARNKSYSYEFKSYDVWEISIRKLKNSFSELCSRHSTFKYAVSSESLKATGNVLTTRFR